MVLENCEALEGNSPAGLGHSIGDWSLDPLFSPHFTGRARENYADTDEEADNIRDKR
jgi:hypothetical protein